MKTVFFDITLGDVGKAAVLDFPDDLEPGNVSVSLVDWTLVSNAYTEPYFQLKFDGCLRTRSCCSGARADMVQLPLFSDRRLVKLDIDVSNWNRRFEVRAYGPGEKPNELGNVRVLVWLLVG